MDRKLLPVAILLVLLLSSILYLVLREEQTKVPVKQLKVAEVLGGAPAEGFARAVTPRKFVFPEDQGAHPDYRNEWWYFTGNLEGPEGRRFGYQLTFFRVALAPHPAVRRSQWSTNQIFMAHFAVTDVQGKRFRYEQRFSRAALGLAGAGGTPLTVWLEDWSAREISPRPWSVRLHADDADIAIDLDLRSLTPEILNGDHGLSRKSATPGNASYYYSIPRMLTTGTIRSGKDTYRVRGFSWLDREWSTSALERKQVGWDWFALQLDDGRDLMFYRLRRRDGSVDPFSGGTLVAADGGSRRLSRDQVQLEATGWWRSPASGARYPAGWRVRVPSQGIDVEVIPRLPDQELLTTLRYWEGAVAVRGLNGTASGSGYLEMTGY